MKKKIKWTEEDIELLKEYSTKYLKDEIAKKLGRTPLAVRAKAKELNIKLYYDVIWTEEMITYLKENINKISLKEISMHLGVSVQKIKNKCNDLEIEYTGVKPSKNWTKEEVQELKEMWNKYSKYKLAEHFHCATKAIDEMAKELNLPEYKSNRWTKEEEELLREYSTKYLTDEIASKLEKSKLSVQKKAIKLGIELHGDVIWTEEMDNYLKENINKISVGKIQEHLNLSYRRVVTRCEKLGIEYITEEWTEEEIEILKEYASKCHYTELVKVLPRRSLGAISAKAFDLGIKTISTYEKLNDEHAKYIKENWGKIPATEMAKNLGIPYSVISRYKKELNLPNLEQKKKWTEEVIEKIRIDAKTMNRMKLAKKYETSITQITKIAGENNIELINVRTIWTEELNVKLKELFEEGLSITEISEELNVFPKSVKAQISKLKLRKRESRYWTDEEVEKLKELSKTLTAPEIAIELNKTEGAVYDKARLIGIELISGRNIWTDEEIETLLQIHDKYTISALSKILDRSESSIYDKAKDLGIELLYKERTLWTYNETKFLKEHSEEYEMDELCDILNRSYGSVSAKLNYMGLNYKDSDYRWSKEEEEKLKELAKTHTVRELANIFNKSYTSIFNKLTKLGVSAKKANRVWTKEEEEKLLIELENHTSLEVAKIMDRSEESIINKSYELGYLTKEEARIWTIEEEEYLKEKYGKISIDTISRKLGRTNSSIMNRAYVLGLKTSKNKDGVYTVNYVAEKFKINSAVISITWADMGLKIKKRKASNNSSYSYIESKELFRFLRKHQDIFSTLNLEENVFGEEPKWFIEKRKQDLINKDVPKKTDYGKIRLMQNGTYYLSDDDPLVKKYKMENENKKNNDII